MDEEKEREEKKEDEESNNQKETLEETIKKENSQMKTFFIIIGGMIALILIGYLMINSLNNFDYEGVKFKIVKEGSLIFYNTAFPYKNGITGKFIGDYNFYIRNDPRKLDKEVAFEGELDLMKTIVLNSEQAFNCEGDGVIAIENMRKMLELMGGEVIRDENATCDEYKRYTYILLKEGNETKIEQVGSSCYDIEIANCEILKATERLMIETFVRFNQQKDNSIIISFSEINQ